MSTHREELADLLRGLKQRLSSLERTPPLILVAAAMVNSGLIVDPSGVYQGTDSTTFETVIACSVYATAPTLDYDVLLWDLGYPVDSMEWRLVAVDGTTEAETVVASGSTTDSSAQQSGYVDIYELLGEEIRGRLIHLNLQGKRTGGDGWVGIGLARPLLLRVMATA